MATEAKKTRRGRKSKYKEEFVEQALKLSLLGATDIQMSEFFEVAESTFNLWKKKHPEFSESLKKGKLQADTNIAASLYNKATGFTKTFKKPFKLKTTINGEGSTEKIEYANEQIYYPPDTTAAIFWLKNRQPEVWRDKREMKAEIKTSDLEGKTNEELEAIVNG